MSFQTFNISDFALLTETDCFNFTSIDLRNASITIINYFVNIVSNLTNNSYTLQQFWITKLFILLFGMISNLSFIVTVVKTSYLHSTIYILLTYLACSDCIILITRLEAIAQILFRYTPINAITIAIGFINTLCVFLSTGFVILASAERYIAICRPLLYHRLRGTKRTHKLIAIVFLLSATMLGTYIPLLLDLETRKKSRLCIIWPVGNKFHEYPIQILIPNPHPLLTVYNILFYTGNGVINLMILASVSYMYSKILVTLGKRKRNTNLQTSTEFKKHIKQVSVMVIVNGSVYLFLMSISFTYPISLLLIDDPNTLRYWQFVTFAAYDINASINPMIYFLTNERYRCAVKTMFRRCFGKATSLQNTQLDSATVGEHQL